MKDSSDALAAPLRRIESWILRSARWKFIATVCLLALLKTGIGLMPNLSKSQAVAQNPFVNPFTDGFDHYLYWNWLGPFVAWAIGARGTLAFDLLHVAFTFAFTALFVVTAFRVLPDRSARIALVLFAAIPASSTAYRWVGMDSITLFLMMAALAFPMRTLVTLAIGLALGMQHFEQGFVAAGALLFLLVVGLRFDPASPVAKRYPLRFAIAMLVGTIAGKVVLVALFRHNDVVVNSGRLYWVGSHLVSTIVQFWLGAPGILWSVLAVGWLAALHHAAEGRRAVPFFATLFALMLLLPVVEDQTRVIAIVTFPLIVACWLLNDAFLARIRDVEVAVFALLWVLVPWAWIQHGLPLWSVFPQDVLFFFEAAGRLR